jgi:hypothetical protein
MRIFLAALALAGCASQPQLTSITRMMYAPPREFPCQLLFVQADMMELSPMGKYDILGYVMLTQLAVADPYAEENRRLVRPRACELGGDKVALMMSSATTTPFGQGSGTVYAVLRDKATAPRMAPQPF